MMQVAFGSGYLFGAYFLSQSKNSGNPLKRLQIFFLGISFASILIAASIHITPVPVYSILVFLPIIGFCIASASIYWRTTIQRNTPLNILGRVSSVSSLMGDVTLPLSFAFYGLLFSIIELPVVIFTSSIVLILMVFLINALLSSNSTNACEKI
jgi:hypothetical protein